MRLLLSAVLAVATIGCSDPQAQQTPPPKSAEKPISSLPDGWKARLDDPAATQTGTVEVEKEALIFSGGPGGIYYKPGMKAEKDYTVTASLTQQKTLTAPQPFGVFVGGADLDKETARYTAFVVRQDGKFRIFTRNAGRDTVVVDWKTAQQMLEPKGVRPTSTLEVRALQNGLHFLIGDKEVHQMPRAAAGPDGIAGIRMGPGLLVQVTRFEVNKFP